MRERDDDFVIFGEIKNAFLSASSKIGTAIFLEIYFTQKNYSCGSKNI
jgi:hypothetical protein